ncbi:hypothetical protein ABZX69_06415 [Streptomyces sp. NPDC004074]|uniref:hypothetical protein n=1 Tax=unclassified Streptomyces TaxID=2593676 RepID=UPI0033ABA70F
MALLRDQVRDIGKAVVDIAEDLGRLLAEQFGGLPRHDSGRRPVARVFGEARSHQAEQVVRGAVEVRLFAEDPPEAIAELTTLLAPGCSCR